MYRRRSILEMVDDAWFSRCEDCKPSVLQMTPAAHRRALHEVRMAERMTTGGSRRPPNFSRYGPCRVVVDLPEQHPRPFLFS